MGLISARIINFSQLYKEDLDTVGKKAVDFSELAGLRIAILDGFVITTSFFKEFLEQTGIAEKIKEVKKLNHPAISESIEKLFYLIKKQIMHTHIPENLTFELYKFYKKLAGPFKDPSLNIFSSSPENNKSVMFKNVKGDANFILKIKEIWASHILIPVAIIVQKNIKSKDKKIVATNDATINDQNLLKLVKKIQKHFYFPKVIEYVIERGKIYVTQVKPFTDVVNERPEKIQHAQKLRKILTKGIPVNPGIVTGPVKLINNQNFAVVKNSEIVVIKNLNKLLYNKIKKAKAVVADNVAQSSIDKLHYRKIIKAPTIIGTKNATKLLQNGNIITVNGTAGEIYSGGFI